MRWDPRTWPTSIKAPTIAAVIMVLAGAAISQQVLARLSNIQNQSLRDLASAYLDGVSSPLMPALMRDDIWEAYETLDRARSRYAGLKIRESVVTTPNGVTVAALSPERFPTASAIPTEFVSSFSPEAELARLGDDGIARVKRDLVYQDRKIGTIWAEIDTSRLVAERQEIARTLLITNAAVTAFFGFLGWLLVRRVMRPTMLLATKLDEAVAGRLTPIDVAGISPEASEAGRLYHRYNALVAAVDERETLSQRLADEERVASLGRLASGMAHEINNPLGGLFNAVDTLRTHGQEPSIAEQCLDLLDRGLFGIKEVVRAALVTYKSGTGEGVLRPNDIEDLRFLITPELRRRRLSLEWKNGVVRDLELPGSSIRQAVLNLLLNAIAATPDGRVVQFEATVSDTFLWLAVSDTGPGMPDSIVRYLVEPGIAGSPITSGQGLGLWVVRRVVADLKGRVAVETNALGTKVTVLLPIPQSLELQRVA